MSRKCELTGIAVQYGNNVSHSQRKTRRCFKPNIRHVVYKSDLTGQKYTVKVVVRAMRIVEKFGGFDAFMLTTKSDAMSNKLLKIKKTIIAKHQSA